MEDAKRRLMDELARAHLGHVSRRQLVAGGWGHATIRRWVERGQLVEAGPSTFRLASWPPVPAAPLMAACLEVDGVASHRAAAWLHGLVPAPVLEVMVERPRSAPRGVVTVYGEPCIVHATTSLPRGDVLPVQGVPATSVARTLLSLGSLVPHELDPDRLTALVATSIDRRLATSTWLWWLLERRRCRGRNGVLAFQEALAEVCRLGPTESWLEREFLALLEAAGVRLPVTQRVIRRSGRFVGRVDFLFGPERLVAEVMGYGFHRTREQLDADTQRANELQLEGFRVLQFTSDQVVNRPRRVVATVQVALAGGDRPVRPAAGPGRGRR